MITSGRQIRPLCYNPLLKSNQLAGFMSKKTISSKGTMSYKDEQAGKGSRLALDILDKIQKAKQQENKGASTVCLTKKPN